MGTTRVVPQLFGLLFRPALRALGRKVHDEDFAVPPTGMFLCGVRELDALHPEAVEDLSHLGYVIQGEQKLPFDGPQNLGKMLKILRFEVVVVQLFSEVRRVEKEECRRAVEIANDFVIRKFFDLDTRKPFMCVMNDLGELFRVEPRRVDHVPVIRRAAHEARKGILEDVEVSRRPLDVCEAFRIGPAQKIELAPAYDCEPQIPNEFLMVVLTDPEEVRDLVVEVVQDLDFRARLVKEHLCSSRKRLDIGLVLRHELNDAFRERAFSSDV